MVGPQLAQFLFQRLGHHGLVGQPMQALENDAGGAAGQKSRSSLRSRHAAPYMQTEGSTAKAQLLPHRRKQGEQGIGADKTGRLISLKREAAGTRHRLPDLFQIRRRSNHPAQPIRRQLL